MSSIDTDDTAQGVTILNDDVQFRSHIKAYWIMWISIIALALVIRFVAVNGENGKWAVFLLYLIPTWFAVGALGFYEGMRFYSYIRTKHPQKWDLESSFLGLTIRHDSVLSPSWKMRNFLLFSNDDLGDPNVRFFRKQNRQFFILSITVFLSILPLDSIIML